MRFLKFLISVWSAILVYALFSFLSGPKGLFAYNQLLYEKAQQLNNINELGFINEELEKVKSNLLFDTDTQLVYARQLGYAQEDERFIRIVGLGTTKTTPGISGNVYTIKEPDFLADRIIKITALIIGLLLFAFLFVMELIETKTK